MFIICYDITSYLDLSNLITLYNIIYCSKHPFLLQCSGKKEKRRGLRGGAELTGADYGRLGGWAVEWAWLFCLVVLWSQLAVNNEKFCRCSLSRVEKLGIKGEENSRGRWSRQKKAEVQIENWDWEDFHFVDLINQDGGSKDK